MCKICRRNRNIEQTYAYIVHHQLVTSNTASSQIGLPVAKVTDTGKHARHSQNNSPVSRICFALNNSTSSRPRAPFKLAYISSIRYFWTTCNACWHCAISRRHVLALRLTGFQVVPSAQEGKRGGEWAWQLLSTLWHGGECIVWSNWPLVCLSRLRDRDAVRRPAARRFVQDAQSATRLAESRSRPRQTNSSSLTPYYAFVAVS